MTWITQPWEKKQVESAAIAIARAKGEWRLPFATEAVILQTVSPSSVAIPDTLTGDTMWSGYFASLVIIGFLAVTCFDIVTGLEHWPFGNYPMVTPCFALNNCLGCGFMG